MPLSGIVKSLERFKKQKNHENYSSRFPEGVQKQEIQQWRQVRSRPGQKEILNIMLREEEDLKPIEIDWK